MAIEGKILASKLAGTTKETSEQKKLKHVQNSEKEGIETQGIGNRFRKHSDQSKPHRGAQQQGIWKPHQSLKETLRWESGKSDKYYEDVDIEIVGNALKKIPKFWKEMHQQTHFLVSGFFN
ncbi:unnamed protein product [Ilex paraguariensis]|uniref:Uncharacterized protein n=1 Tax=Ilex paraguariensis TaxID=185542 RepID=A0ABC8SGJ2_9AQUA